MIETQEQINKRTIKALKQMIRQIKNGENVTSTIAHYDFIGDFQEAEKEWMKYYTFISVELEG